MHWLSIEGRMYIYLHRQPFYRFEEKYWNSIYLHERWPLAPGIIIGASQKYYVRFSSDAKYPQLNYEGLPRYDLTLLQDITSFQWSFLSKHEKKLKWHRFILLLFGLSFLSRQSGLIHQTYFRMKFVLVPHGIGHFIYVQIRLLQLKSILHIFKLQINRN